MTPFFLLNLAHHAVAQIANSTLIMHVPIETSAPVKWQLFGYITAGFAAAGAIVAMCVGCVGGLFWLRNNYKLAQMDREVELRNVIINIRQAMPVPALLPG
jgi:hypothetical protein